MSYDSTNDTYRHIGAVEWRLAQMRNKLLERSTKHDASKLESPEKEIFDVMTPRLKELTYGSDEYKAALAEMGEALKHHYAVNSHHPEHYPNGIEGMSLLDVMEMLCDWKAASERHADGNLGASLEINRKRFGISDQLMQILINSVREMEW